MNLLAVMRDQFTRCTLRIAELILKRLSTLARILEFYEFPKGLSGREWHKAHITIDVRNVM